LLSIQHLDDEELGDSEEIGVIKELGGPARRVTPECYKNL
jgi:hypothetical protein